MSDMPERLQRIHVGELDEILGRALPVLDDGFVRVIDYMGNDESIVQAARVSYGLGTKRVSEDRGLIRYLLRHAHTTPFEMCEIKLHVRVPMDTWRQWIRHRTANVNEYSTRYSIAIDATQRTDSTAWRLQEGTNRQGSAGFVPQAIGARLSEREQEIHAISRSVYQERIDAGVAREQARKDLPLSTYTEAYWKVDLHNLLHFLRLRMDSHAQWEIQQYAQVIGSKIVAAWCPLAWEAFRDYRLNATSFSDFELKLIKALLAGELVTGLALAQDHGWLDAAGLPSKRNRERKEFETKAVRIGLGLPWRT